MTVSHHLKYTTASPLTARTTGQVLRELKIVFGIYKKRGFKVKEIRTGPEFNLLCDDFTMMGITYNEVAVNEHVPVVEHQIRVIKERVRCAWSKLPYNIIPKKMVIALVKMVVLWLNNSLPGVE